MRGPLLAFLTLLLLAAPLSAKVGSLSLAEMADASEVIVLAKVDSVSWLPWKRYATATIEEVWKGKETRTVEFLASPTWTCDVSEAVKGERVVLFLTHDPESRSYAIAHAGRGRMPLRTVGGKAYATFWPEVDLPEGTPTIDGPEPEWDFIRSIEVETLRNLVRK